MTTERPSPHADIPRDASGRPDDRFDGTDSGPDGWDAPYPPQDPEAVPDLTGATGPPADRPAPSGGGAPAVEERTPTTALDPLSYYAA